ncbi:interleukin-17A [Tachyglossus aculeatus]|uniref:interleukin-17A n=1 Tax=Tachyglossus aculeatus TaxID=9261 RepID=UPI0018F4E823|nr:interleukin-17A [Tachyglossus aculeatus]
MSPLFQFPFLTLVLMATLQESVFGKAIAAKQPKDNLLLKKEKGCPSSGSDAFPHSVTVNLSITNQNGTSKKFPAINKRSTSPWEYHLNEDPNRFPAKIWEAKCSTTGCLDAQKKEDPLLNSLPIYQETLVLKRDSQSCPTSFRMEKIIVSVGCTCVTPNIHRLG